jgi:hypothetical protein
MQSYGSFRDQKDKVDDTRGKGSWRI